jgi:hypothetical protein
MVQKRNAGSDNLYALDEGRRNGGANVKGQAEGIIDGAVPYLCSRACDNLVATWI